MAPFKSKSQQRFIFLKKPKMAKRWADETPDIKGLPEKKNLNELIKKGKKRK